MIIIQHITSHIHIYFEMFPIRYKGWIYAHVHHGVIGCSCYGRPSEMHVNSVYAQSVYLYYLYTASRQNIMNENLYRKSYICMLHYTNGFGNTLIYTYLRMIVLKKKFSIIWALNYIIKPVWCLLKRTNGLFVFLCEPGLCGQGLQIVRMAWRLLSICVPWDRFIYV